MTQHQLIYGMHAVRHALQQLPDSVREIWIQKNKQSSRALKNIIELSNRMELSIQYVSGNTLDKMSNHHLHQGVIIRVKSSPSVNTELGSLLSENNDRTPLYLILDGIQDPHNLGACLRTADAAGVGAVIIPKNRAVQVNATVKKVACGAAEHMPVIRVTNLARTLRELQKAGIWIIGTANDARESIYDIDYGLPTALILGAEGKGIRTIIRKHCDKLVSIPMLGKVESLNVSVAAGICLYEIIRQRGRK